MLAPTRNEASTRDEKTVWIDRAHMDIRVSSLEDGHCAGFGGGAVFGFDFGLAAVRLAPSAPQRT